MAEPTPLTITIDRLGDQGDGLAEEGGRSLIVPRTLPGERVTVRPAGRRGNVERAELVAVEQPAPERVEPPCRHFAACGGCALQHASAAFIAAWRRQVIARALMRVRLDVEVAAPVNALGRGRRRARWTAAMDGGGRVTLGYHQRRSWLRVDIAECPLVDDRLVALAAPLRAALCEVLPEETGADLAVGLADNGIDLLLVGPTALSLDARMALVALAETSDVARISWQPRERSEPETVLERRPPFIVIDDVRVPLPPGAFLQATAEGEAAMVGLAMEWLAGAARIADLYAGLGTFALPLSRGAQVTACEAAPELVAALDAAARGGQRARLTVERRDLERRPLQRDELARLDAVLLDPPRAGAAKQCTVLAEHGPPLVVMASCYPSTFARDARTLADGGYRLAAVQPVDQFGWSHHVELIARFER